jgi:biopolymer transport protein ExbB/TolQ
MWLKAHWVVPFLIAWSILVWVLARKDFNAAKQVSSTRVKSYEDQILAIKDAHNKEIIKRDGLISEYNETISKIKKEFVKREKVLEKDHERTVREMIVKSKNNPEEIKRLIEREFGFKNVE